LPFIEYQYPKQKKTNQIKMKFLIVFALVIVAAIAAPVDDAKDAKITRLEQDDVRADGYKFA
jgi:hypothetical protein